MQPLQHLCSLTFDELCAACPTPPSHERPDSSVSSTTSASEEEPDSDDVDSNHGACNDSDEESDRVVNDPVLWKIKQPVRAWADRRHVQITEGAYKCVELGLITQTQANEVVVKSRAVLDVVTADQHACDTLRMASSGFWMFGFVMVEKFNEWNMVHGEGWVIKGQPDVQTPEQLQAEAAKWTLDGLEELFLPLKGDKFKNLAKGDGQYQTQVGGKAGKKHGFSQHVTGGNDPTNRFDLRKLGTDSRRKSKFCALHLLMQAAGQSGIPNAIYRLEPPKIAFYNKSGSLRAEALQRVSGDMEANLPAREERHMQDRTIFVGARSAGASFGASSAVPHRGGLSTGASDRRANTSQPMFNLHPSSDDDSGSEFECEDGGHTAVAKKTNQIKKPAFDAELDDGDTEYLEQGVTAEDALEEDPETEEQRKLRFLIERRNGKPAPSTVCSSSAVSVAVEEPKALQPPPETTVQRLKREYAENRAEKERKKPDDDAILASWFSHEEKAPVPLDIDEIGALIGEEDDEAPSSVDGRADGDEDLTFFTSGENAMLAADPVSNARAQAEAAEQATLPHGDNERLSTKEFRTRQKFERAQDALAKRDNGDELKGVEQQALEWYLDHVDIDESEKTGEMILKPKAKRTLTLDQALAKRRRETANAAKAQRRLDRQDARRLRLKTEFLAKRDKQNAAREKRDAKKSAEYIARCERDTRIANAKIQKEVYAQNKQKKMQDDQKSKRDKKLAVAREELEQKLQTQRGFKKVSVAHVTEAPSEGQDLRLVFRLPAPISNAASSAALPKPTRAERFAQRTLAQKRAGSLPSDSDVPIDMNKFTNGTIAANGCTTVYVNMKPSGPMRDFPKLKKRDSPFESAGASPKRSRG